jgi:glycosyltransferase involved in cell wall biosynthesis
LYQAGSESGEGYGNLSFDPQSPNVRILHNYGYKRLITPPDSQMDGESLPKVLQVIDTLGMGGAETWLMEMLRLWERLGSGRMDFLVTSGNRGIFDDEATRLGAKIHYLRYGRAQLPKFVPAFRRILREGGYGAIHDHQDYASGWHFLAARSALPRIRVTHVHNPSYMIRSNYGTSLVRRLTASIGRRLIARHATRITGTSRQVITEYGFDAPEFDRIPKRALHCGFDTARFIGDVNAAKASVCEEVGWPTDSRIILFAGRIDRSPDLDDSQNHKNSAFAVSVSIECARRDPRARVLFAGSASPAVPILQRRIDDAGLRDRIQFLGIRRDIERLMLASDVLLFPSRGEGLGMVAVEAQAAGLPVLAASSVPRECVVVPELVRFRQVSDGQSRWADDLLELADCPRDIVTSNRRVAESAFSIDYSSRALLELYRGE